MQLKKTLGTALAISAGFSTLPAQAAVVIDIVESGPDVVATGSGTIDLSGLTFLGEGETGSGIEPQSGGLSFVEADVAAYRGISGPASFGGGSFVESTNSSGVNFGFFASDDVVVVPLGYTSNAPLSAAMTFAGASFASLGLTPGTYLYSLPNDTITLNIGAIPAVPEPTSWALMVLGLGFVGGAMRSAKGKRKGGTTRPSATLGALGFGTVRGDAKWA